MRPMTDLCWTCQKNSTSVLNMRNHSEQEKADALREATEYVQFAQREGEYYNHICKERRKSVHENYPRGPPPPFSSIPPASVHATVHYSFDMALQVHYPSDPMQPGPIYFLTLRKCTVFGVCCEAIPRQICYLTDEAADCGKGANSIISRLHHFFSHHSLGEDTVFLHADNCCGQNKNNTMVQYLMWHTMIKLHSSATLSFLVVGHTKFSPDWYFGLFKRKYRRTMIGRLQDIVDAVNKSAECNVAQVVDEQDGTVIVPTYDWAQFFSRHFKKLINIKSYHHFRFSSETPGCVFVKNPSIPLKCTLSS